MSDLSGSVKPAEESKQKPEDASPSRSSATARHLRRGGIPQTRNAVRGAHDKRAVGVALKPVPRVLRRQAFDLAVGLEPHGALARATFRWSSSHHMKVIVPAPDVGPVSVMLPAK